MLALLNLSTYWYRCAGLPSKSIFQILCVPSFYLEWHNAFNACAGEKCPYYELVAALHEEAKFVRLQVVLVSEGKMRRRERVKYQSVQSCLFHYWQEYIYSTLESL